MKLRRKLLLVLALLIMGTLNSLAAEEDTGVSAVEDLNETDRASLAGIGARFGNDNPNLNLMDALLLLPLGGDSQNISEAIATTQRLLDGSNVRRPVCTAGADRRPAVRSLRPGRRSPAQRGGSPGSAGRFYSGLVA